VPAAPVVLRTRTLPGTVTRAGGQRRLRPEGRPTPFGTAVSVNLSISGMPPARPTCAAPACASTPAAPCACAATTWSAAHEHAHEHAPRGRQRGVSLIDALIAIAILSFGLLGMTRMQGRMVTAATDAQLRHHRRADGRRAAEHRAGRHRQCRLLHAAAEPAPAPAGAAAAPTDWSTRVTAALPGTVTRTVLLDAATGRMTVTSAGPAAKTVRSPTTAGGDRCTEHPLSRHQSPGDGPRRRQRGVSIIELMVGLVVAMLVGLAATSSAVVFTASQRQGIGVGGVVVNVGTALAALKNDAATAGLGFFGDSRYLCAA
jgi:Tfp pilus assembly protein PilV